MRRGINGTSRHSLGAQLFDLDFVPLQAARYVWSFPSLT
jgi:hypothetical protein